MRVEALTHRLGPETIELARKQAASTLYEAAGQCGAMDAGIHGIAPGMRVCGPALPVRCQPGDNLTLHAAIAVAQPGDVIVADVGRFTEAGHWGEVLTAAAEAKQIAGLVIDGGVRDVEAAQQRGFPVFARAISMKATVKRVFGSINEPVSCGGVMVHAGDLVLGDDDGVVIVRADQVELALQAAIDREDRETAIMKRLEVGELTLDVLGFRHVLHEQEVQINDTTDG